MGETKNQPERAADEPAFLSRPPMRYPNEYVWLVFVSSMDLALTWLILSGLEGEEVNPIATFILEGLKGETNNPFDNSVLSLVGYNGLILFKFALILFVILVCEIVGRRKDRTGRRLARFGVVVSAIPMLVAFYLLITEVMQL